jgi:hypothetical protein
MQHASLIRCTPPRLDDPHRLIKKKPGIVNMIMDPGNLAAINCAIMKLATWPPNQHDHFLRDAPRNTLSTRSHDFLIRLWKTTGARDIGSVYL